MSLLHYLSLKQRPPRSPLFPYTTLFRSHETGQPLLGNGIERAMHHLDDAFAEMVHRDAPSRCTISAKASRSEEHTSELQSHHDLVCRLLLEKKKKINQNDNIILQSNYNT